MDFPKDLKYSKDHIWVKVDADRATIGITDFAQSWIGNLVNIDLLKVGSEIESMGLFGVLETSKVSFELYSPISGTIVKRNEKLVDQITLINHEPYGEGWMIVLHMRDTGDPLSLMDADVYKEYVKSWGYTEKAIE